MYNFLTYYKNATIKYLKLYNHVVGKVPCSTVTTMNNNDNKLMGPVYVHI